MQNEDRTLTYGERAVGLTFNPSNDPKVQEIKQMFAKIIDIINDHPTLSPEHQEMQTKAVREAQTAQMWSVKVVTWK